MSSGGRSRSYLPVPNWNADDKDEASPAILLLPDNGNVKGVCDWPPGRVQAQVQPGGVLKDVRPLRETLGAT